MLINILSSPKREERGFISRNNNRDRFQAIIQRRQDLYPAMFTKDSKISTWAKLRISNL